MILSLCTLCIQAASLHPALCYPFPDCTFKIYERHFRPGHNFPRFSGMIANVHVSNLPRDTRIGFVNKSSISTAVNRTRFGGFAYSSKGCLLFDSRNHKSCKNMFPIGSACDFHLVEQSVTTWFVWRWGKREEYIVTRNWKIRQSISVLFSSAELNVYHSTLLNIEKYRLSTKFRFIIKIYQDLHLSSCFFSKYDLNLSLYSNESF